MKKLITLSTRRRTRKVCVLVCVVSMLIIMGAIIMGSFISLQHLLYGGHFLNHELTKELIKHIQIQEIPLFSRDTHEVNQLDPLFSRNGKEVHQDGQVSQDNTIDYKLINTIIKDANYNEEEVLRTKDVKYKGPSSESPYEIVIRRENFDSKMKGTRKGCTKTKALLKVFMYDLPPELHFGMIEPINVKEGNIWPINFTKMVSYPGGLYLQHSPEFWLTLDLLNNFEEEEKVVEGGHKDLLKEEEEKKDDDHDGDEEERGHNMFNSSYSRVKEGHVVNEFKGNAIYKTFLDRRGHFVNDFLNPKEEKETLKEYFNTKIEVNNMFSPKVERGHDFSSNAKGERRRPCGAIRVKDAKDADVYFVPFFSSLSYNKYSKLGMKEKDRELQKMVVNYVVNQEAWKRSKGRDHIILMHHPNSLQMARTLLEGATFVVADFGRFSSNVAHLGKDIVAPYKHIVPSFHEDNTSFHSRPILLFFQGAILRKEGGTIRKKLYSLIKNQNGVVFRDRIHGSKGIKSATKGMRSSKFCLHLAGDTPSSNRLFDAIASHCVPVIISKDIELPYEDALDYSEFCIFIDPSHALKEGFLIGLLRSIPRNQWTKMWERLKEVQVHFEYQFPSQDDDAIQMLWKSIANKVPSIKQHLHKYERYSRSNTFKRLSF